MSGGDLSEELVDLQKSKGRSLWPENELWFIAFEVATALKYLHDKLIVHRDIKCQNIVITADRHVKICDLGEAMII